MISRRREPTEIRVASKLVCSAMVALLCRILLLVSLLAAAQAFISPAATLARTLGLPSTATALARCGHKLNPYKLIQCPKPLIDSNRTFIFTTNLVTAEHKMRRAGEFDQGAHCKQQESRMERSLVVACRSG
jgi:hypothetical protein